MTSDVKKIYLFHIFNSVALSVVANILFLDKILLRSGLNMSQFGIIKGFAWLLPTGLTLILSPLVMRLQLDRIVISLCYLLRVVIPYMFLVLPQLTQDRTTLTFGFTMVLMVVGVFPSLANNSIFVLCKSHIPQKTLGKHMSLIGSFWELPSLIIVIPIAWYVDKHSAGSDVEFYTSLFYVYLLTTVFQLFASWIILRVSKPPKRNVERDDTSFRSILEPLKDRRFRLYLDWLFMWAIIVGMSTSFLNPYLIDGQSLNLKQISILGVVFTSLTLVFRPMWGYLADKFGGRNVICLGIVGVAVGLFALTGKGIIFVIIFGALAWMLGAGLFATAVNVGSQYLMLSLSHENKSNVYVATARFVGACGLFVGSLGGGVLLDWLKNTTGAADPTAYYRIYFTYCALGTLLLGGAAAAMRDGRRKVRRTQMALAMYQGFRGLFDRRR